MTPWDFQSERHAGARTWFVYRSLERRLCCEEAGFLVVPSFSSPLGMRGRRSLEVDRQTRLLRPWAHRGDKISPPFPPIRTLLSPRCILAVPFHASWFSLFLLLSLFALGRSRIAHWQVQVSLVGRYYRGWCDTCTNVGPSLLGLFQQQTRHSLLPDLGFPSGEGSLVIGGSSSCGHCHCRRAWVRGGFAISRRVDGGTLIKKLSSVRLYTVGIGRVTFPPASHVQTGFEGQSWDVVYAFL